MLDSPSPSHLSSMRIIWGTHPLQLRAHPLTALSYHSPHSAGGGRAAFPGVPGPVFRPQTCLEPERPHVPLHSVCLLEPGLINQAAWAVSSATLLVTRPGVGSTTAVLGVDCL